MTAAVLLASLAGLVGIGLALAGQRFTDRPDTMVEQIDALLPQQQCLQCGYPGCRPYAEAIAKGEADINQCPPGGDSCIRDLAQLLQRTAAPLNEQFGVYKPAQLALIDEHRCIGCTLCIDHCPVDAIIGAPQAMHTVLTEACTGCELCLPPCPVDCISLRAGQ